MTLAAAGQRRWPGVATATQQSEYRGGGEEGWGYSKKIKIKKKKTEHEHRCFMTKPY